MMRASFQLRQRSVRICNGTMDVARELVGRSGTDPRDLAFNGSGGLGRTALPILGPAGFGPIVSPFAIDLLAARPGAADLGQELVSLLIYRGARLEATKPWVAGELV
jgi:hypothetical protein